MSPTISIATPHGPATVAVEIAKTRDEIARGLMHRRHLPYDAGMLFLMGSDGVWSFYMRNTLIPLDMIFITRDLHVAGIISEAQPRTETLRSIGLPSAYVLEVNGGWVRAHQVVPGAEVQPGFRSVPISPPRSVRSGRPRE